MSMIPTLRTISLGSFGSSAKLTTKINVRPTSPTIRDFYTVNLNVQQHLEVSRIQHLHGLSKMLTEHSVVVQDLLQIEPPGNFTCAAVAAEIGCWCLALLGC